MGIAAEVLQHKYPPYLPPPTPLPNPPPTPPSPPMMGEESNEWFAILSLT